MPDNVENMDKMLEQFSGRGEKLIVTLTLCAADNRRRASSSARMLVTLLIYSCYD